MYEPFLTPLPRIIAHRGDSHNYPENTLEAFVSAMNMGIDVIETDVHLTKDNQIVVWHDPTLERNTDGVGKIEDFTLSELKKFDAGYMFTQDGGKSYPFRGKGVSMTTLEEALIACPNQRFNVDLKSKEREIVPLFNDLVVKHGAQERILCASFHLKNLQFMRVLNPDILTSLTTMEVLPLLIKQKLGMLKQRAKFEKTVVFQVPVSQWGIQVITKEFIKTFHRLGAVIQVWTINEAQQMRELFELGVDSIMTDDPTTLISVAQELSLI